MSRNEARDKALNTFRDNMVQYANEHPEFSLDEFKLERADVAFFSWRDARTAEREKDWHKARKLYKKAVESYSQFEKLEDSQSVAKNLEMLKTEFYNFVVHRDPVYRLNLKHPLLYIKETPGILQTDLYKHFPDRMRDSISFALYFAEQEGIIRREKKGRSYLLFFERDKADDEPFLKLQDDEYDLLLKSTQEIKARKGCLLVFSFLFWIIAIGVAWAIGKMVGVCIAVAAFIIWLFVRKGLQKKQKPEDATPPQSDVSIPEQPENSEQKREANEKDA
ncbi:MAG: hypothetical protein LBB81_00805 [Treponema sp.]|jgi:ribosomal protein L14E/L6E/L27E|nr:hypothetical protein [Treponema sp.]